MLEADKHPNADRLSVCRVDVGDGDPAQIVCGAPNVAAGQTVAVAKPGAVMPDGSELGAAKLRGIESQGMILAEDELGIGSDHAGILVLDDDLEPGQPLVDALPIATDVIELEITPNRPDCLGVYGLAREVHAITGAPLATPPWSTDPGSPGPVQGAEVVVEDDELCPRFTARVYDDVRIGPSPPWLKARLMAAGQRPINNVVDITNFVMLLTGHPLHAFDLDRVAGHRLVVRPAHTGERIELLDGAVRELEPPMVVILDDDGPTSLAGIMGGSRSEVSEATTRVLMEVASWNGPNIQRTSRKLGVRSEASSRFEKGLSPEAALEAQVMASILMEHVVGATLAPGTIDVGGPGPDPARLTLRPARVAALLGIDIPAERCAEILEALGFGVSGVDGEAPFAVTVPHWRRLDVTREIDLVEEVARVDGLERLPATLPARRGAYGVLRPDQQRRRRRRGRAGRARAVRDRGLELRLPRAARPAAAGPRRPAAPAGHAGQPAVLGAVGPAPDAAGLAAGQRPQQRRPRRGRRAPVRARGGLRRRAAAGVAARGDRRRPRPAALRRAAPRRRRARPCRHAADRAAHGRRRARGRGAAGDVARPRAAAGRLLRRQGRARGRGGGAAGAAGLRPRRRPAVPQPGARRARVRRRRSRSGWIGELHPAVAAEWELPGAAVFEVDLEALFAVVPGPPAYEDVTSFPAVHRDLAIVVPEAVPAGAVLDVLRASPLAEHVAVFDVYRGAQVDEDAKSLAVHVSFRAPDRTLTDEEVDREVAALTERLRALGGELRA